MPDLERPLNKRGRQEAPLMGRYMAKANWRPAHIICSPAVRTRQTLDGWRAGFGKDSLTIPVTFDDHIYEASVETMLDRIRASSPDVRSLMLVGHNPGCESLSRTLIAATSAEPLVVRLHSSEFATAALACIQFDWMTLLADCGQLLDFKVPTDVKGANL